MGSRVTWLMGVLAVALGGAGAAAAHTSYLLPSNFSPATEEVVTIQASFGERQFFRPEVAVASDDFHVLRPDGRRDTFDRIATFTQVTILESDVKEAGTYRFTTGERLGRAGRQVLENGEWRAVEPGQASPPGARTRTSQTVTVAEAYVTKGAPTRPAVDAPSGRLTIRTDAHPSEIYLEKGLTLAVAFDGAPLAGQVIEIDREGGALEAPKYHQELKTDAAGRLRLEFDRPGTYLVMVRHAADAPQGAATEMRSYTSSLTFEVLP
jgi:hypothetical protein